MKLRDALVGRDLRNVAIVASGAASSDIEAVLEAIESAQSRAQRLSARYRGAIVRPVRAGVRRVRGSSAPAASRDLKAHVVAVIAPENEPDWHLWRFNARHLSGKSLIDINWQLKRFGPCGAIIDLSRDPELPHDRTWARLFLHLRDRGVYVSREEANGTLGPRLARVLEGRGEKWARGAVESIVFSESTIVVGKKGHHYLKLRDHEVDRFLPTRDIPATANLLAKLPAGELTSRTNLALHPSSAEPAWFDRVMSHPDMRMRHYTGRIALATHSLLYTEATLLPETYRHHLQKPLDHTRVIDRTEQFGSIADEHRPIDHLAGDYYNLDSPFTGHFGHITTEVLSRLWGWDEAKRRLPDLKVIWRIRYPNDRDPDLEKQLFRAYGIADEDMVWVDEPVWLDSVVGVTPMWHNQVPHYVHPEMTAVWKRIGDSLATDDVCDSPRLFVSRRAGLARSCRNGDEVEDLFRRYGFTIIYPEDLSLCQQASVFRQAQVVAGFGGSAMFNVMYATGLRHLIVLTHESYTARNEYMFASLLGGQTDYFWSAADMSHPDGGWSQEAFTSSWDFDFDRNGKELEHLLSSLP